MTALRAEYIKDWDHFVRKVKKYEGGSAGFRGVSSADHDVIPSIGRKGLRPSYSKKAEEEIFSRFKKQAIPHLANVPSTELAWLALARHCGLPTRLLDWSTSPLVAAFFAVAGTRPDSGTPSDCAVFAFETPDNYDDEETVKDPFKVKEAFIEVLVSHISSRIPAQKGFFTLHSQPNKPFRHKSLRKFVIPGRLRNRFQEKLDFYGINNASLFPDADGLAAYLAWYYREA